VVAVRANAYRIPAQPDWSTRTPCLAWGDMETARQHRNGAGPILFAYDGSDEAKAAIGEAARQLNPNREAIVLTVWQSVGALPFAGMADGVAVDESIAAEALTVAREGAELANSAGFRATPLVESGSPTWQSIVTSAEQHAASLVVMGSHGRTGLGYVLMGSIAAAVARHGELPVLIVHAPSDDSDA
jgi:nucleotide-binding universal stress UspA family protein